jgi:hypothetical protein
MVLIHLFVCFGKAFSFHGTIPPSLPIMLYRYFFPVLESSEASGPFCAMATSHHPAGQILSAKSHE